MIFFIVSGKPERFRTCHWTIVWVLRKRYNLRTSCRHKTESSRQIQVIWFPEIYLKNFHSIHVRVDNSRELIPSHLIMRHKIVSGFYLPNGPYNSHWPLTFLVCQLFSCLYKRRGQKHLYGFYFNFFIIFVESTWDELNSHHNDDLFGVYTSGRLCGLCLFRPLLWH